MTLSEISTPSALVDATQMQHNIDRMQQRMNALGVAFRPHVKTTKCLPIVQAQIAAGARGITVSTLKEAEQFFAAGIGDILYAVGMAPNKIAQAAALVQRGWDLYNRLAAVRYPTLALVRGHCMGGGTELALFPRPGGTKAEHTALSFKVADIATEIRELEARGVQFADYDLPGLKTIEHVCVLGSEKAAWFLDPEGNILCLHEELPMR